MRAPDGWYYLTYTRLNHIDHGEEGVQLWRSRDLATWEGRGVFWTFDDSTWIQPLAAQARLEDGKDLLRAPELHLLDGRHVSPERVVKHGIDPAEAQSINEQGLTLVPRGVRIADGDVYIRAKDPDYARPGPEEVQNFPD